MVYLHRFHLETEAVGSSETLVSVYNTIRRHNPKDHNQAKPDFIKSANVN
jgi:hypothetical protein